MTVPLLLSFCLAFVSEPASGIDAMVQDGAVRRHSVVYRDPGQPVDRRVADLVSRLTLEEKISLLLYDSPAVPRLGIPRYNWWNECLHGVARAGRATVFPQVIGLAATFDVSLVNRVAQAIADEARAKHHLAVRKGRRSRYGGLTFWTPNVNIFRDPRWGRGQETYGEDPFLSGALGSAFVRGLQGNHDKYLKAAACAKHFAVHSGPEGLRHEFNAVVSQRDLRETYLPAFKALVESHVEAVMCAYNRTNGKPCCGSDALLQKILRDEWGFKGHVVSDCWALSDMHNGHKVTPGAVDSAALAILSGVDLNCGSVFPHLVEAVRQGKVDERDINSSLTRLFRTRIRLGQFDPPDEVPFSKIKATVIRCPKHRKLAREAAVRSIVLLKNKNGVLPLSRDLTSLYVLGPTATSSEVLFGNYHGLAPDLVTILEGVIGSVDPACAIRYSPGCLLDRSNPSPIDWTTPDARMADAIIAVFGLSPILEGEEGESIASPFKGDRETIELPANQVAFLKKLRRECSKPIILVLTGGGPIAIPEIHELADAILFAWYPGEQGGHAVADVLFGEVSPAGRLPVTFPRSTESLPPYEDYRMTGRTYRYLVDEPLYPFGFGLAYTQFRYDPLTLSRSEITSSETITALTRVTNTGKRIGDEVVQLYIGPVKPQSGEPILSLRGFERFRLQPGESRQIEFKITCDMLSFFNETGQLQLRKGDMRISVAGAAPIARSRTLGGAAPASAIVKVK